MRYGHRSSLFVLTVWPRVRVVAKSCLVMFGSFSWVEALAGRSLSYIYLVVSSINPDETHVDPPKRSLPSFPRASMYLSKR
ncbi:hypothetical protein DFH06DRAFT_234613 [Mycena polygramma]|nr:hypothetical protein DFH06DRAFT_234613 [Mycena polygramma]